ncbi:MAG TPA: CcoQ/FixQ family Cbb3-type cytochrome c oxidase assembly chaperone [Rheinheimera sp.]|uniref:cbb3-type cytochrome oxidase subunit 3 n=1 Tax=unclassified Rheinheimera TaxID=115860 RepID=UPI000EE669BF|nr:MULTISPECIES: CcoQ/FixQ family Cbb3-type cytochrome c oxidase assembly chaperone [unclassified Rheinheimera]MCT6700689.1 CcoQ/FixQ family Cbb3-type cytochrome c oxidase assembly chaperone [Rheinheimera sp. 4Y26]HCU64359.1 CcoQ/FixQ family Cbb3-type cytochrome c oxidase assembly chaperone [Rheinheimera sp.]
MDYATIHSFYTVIILVAFVGLLVWVFLIKRKPDFDDAANAIFADEQKSQQKQQQESDHE